MVSQAKNSTLLFVIVPYLIKFWPLLGINLCKNGPKLLKINISCMFWPNNVWKLFSTLFYEIFLVKQIFNICCHCGLFDQVFAPFSGSCHVNLAKNNSKSIFHFVIVLRLTKGLLLSGGHVIENNQKLL